MIKLIIFDLDGVLVETKKIHYEALNLALGETYSISWDEHLSKYDGLKTNQKLSLLTNEKGLPITEHKLIWEEKQKITLEKLSLINPSKNLTNTIKNLVDSGYKIACCSNSIRKTVNMVLSKLGIIEFFDYILSNEDVKNGKPHPEIYWKTITHLGVLPNETLIIEDSPFGLLSANRTKSHVMRVKSTKDLTIDNIKNFIKNVKMEETPKWKNNKLNVLIPMAGAGSRFEKSGYLLPKPLIDVNGSPMIQLVVNNLSLDANFIYVVQKSHRLKYNLDTLLNLITPNCEIIEVDGLTEGAACTALLAKDLINNENPLFFSNSDQFVEWDSNEFMYKMQETEVDGGIVTFESTHPKWSFVKLNNDGYVTEVSEKKPISDIATVGYYYWKKGSDFVKYSEQMINNNIRVNNEFYVCPVFNEAILDGKKIITYTANKMWGLGTPEDLNYYLENHKK
jgi:HAD superfamily hydrolase (TIGR01509 family)